MLMSPFETLPCDADLLRPLVEACFTRERPADLSSADAINADAEPVAQAAMKLLATADHPTVRLMRLAMELVVARKCGHKFYAGPIVVTAGIAHALGDNPASVLADAVIARHLSGDWGDVDNHNAAANDDALLRGSRILSVYDNVGVGDVFFQTLWVITEQSVVADEDEPALNRLRYSTTILLPSEY